MRLRLGRSLVLLAGLLLSATAQNVDKPFITSISGEGGPPIRDTPVDTPGTSTMYLFKLDKYPGAVCNDGSPAGYYYAPGNGTTANDWLVYLEGSMFCWDEKSCQERLVAHDYWMSSTLKPWTYDFAQGGIFATDGSSPWGTANRIYVKYCSSDFWSGNAPGSADTPLGLSFMGSVIVQSVIEDLVATQGLGSEAGARLLFSGCSAGAIGAMNNLERVIALVPPTVQVQGFLDGAALLDIYPAAWSWSDMLVPLQELMANLTLFANPVFPPYCAQLFGADTWKCLIGQYRMPLITSVPFFINAPQFDMFNIMYDTDNYAPASPAQYKYVDSFQSGVLALIAALPPGTGVFAPTCLVHCLSGQTSFQELTLTTSAHAPPVSLDDTLSAWYFGGPGSVGSVAVSPCSDWACVNACGVDLQVGLPCNMGTVNCSALTLATDPGATTSTDKGSSDSESSDNRGGGGGGGGGGQGVSASAGAAGPAAGAGGGSSDDGSEGAGLVSASQTSLSADQQSTLSGLTSEYSRLTHISAGTGCCSRTG